MTTVGRDLHRRLDREHAEAQARDGGSDGGQRDIARPQRWRSEPGPRQPKVLLVRFVQKMSQRGTIYLRGWMGSARLVGFLSNEPDKDGNQVWDIYAAEPAPRESGPASR
jgi:hypothetical protein